MPTNNPVVQTVMKPETYDKLTKIAENNNLSISKLASIIIEQYVNKEKEIILNLSAD